MFAIDGVKLPSNASKYRSGKRADFERQAEKLEAAAKTMLQHHRAEDTAPTELDPTTKEAKRVERLERDAAQIRDWLSSHLEALPDPLFARGNVAGVHAELFRIRSRCADLCVPSRQVALPEGAEQCHEGVRRRTLSRREARLCAV